MKRASKFPVATCDAVLVMAFTGILGGILPGNSHAATIQVTEFHDVQDDADGTCTLREAIRSANQNTDIDSCSRVGGGNDIVVLAAGVYDVDLVNGSAEDLGVDGDLDISTSVEIRGISADHTVITNTGSRSIERVVDIIAGFVPSTVILRDLTVAGGAEPNGIGGNIRLDSEPGRVENTLRLIDVVVSEGFALNGGGIHAVGNLQLRRTSVLDNLAQISGGGLLSESIEAQIEEGSVIEGNRAANGSGGGVLIRSQSATIRDSSIVGNDAPSLEDDGSGCGGGVVLEGLSNDLLIERTLIAENTASRGGGICWRAAPRSNISHSAIVNNNASQEGGGLFATAQAFIRYSTISGNTAPIGGGAYTISADTVLFDAVTLAGNLGGGGLHNAGGALFEFSLLADNAGGNCVGTAPSAGPFNLDDANTCDLLANDTTQTSLTNVDPMLGPLQDNGGGLPTLALLTGSPAIDAYNSVDRADCQQTPDQRTWARGYPPVLGDGSDDDFLCDIGAYEFTTPFFVTSTDDTVDADIDDGLCLDANGNCTLRAAVMQASGNQFVNEIELSAGTFSLTLAGSGDVSGVSGDLNIRSDLIIRGAGADQTVIDGAGLDRLIGPPGPVSILVGQPELNLIALQDLTLSGGSAPEGGAISIEKPLMLERVVIRDSAATSGRGGAVLCENECELTLIDSVLQGNSAAGNGGAVFYSADRPLLLGRSTVTDNSANIGGAMEVTSAFRAINSTFSGNTAGSTGAVFANRAIVEFSTVTANSASNDTGGLYTTGPSVVGGSIVAANLVATIPDNCNFTPSSLSSTDFNLSDTDSTDCNLVAAADIVNTDAMLGALADNGGLTPTHEPMLGSAAIDQVNSTRCPATDQRGLGRPPMAAASCDIGAVELQFADLAAAISANSASVSQGTNVILTITAINNGPSVAANVVAEATLPAGLAFVSANSAVGTCAAASGVVTCGLGELAANTNVLATVTVTAQQAGTFAVPVELSSNSIDDQTGNSVADVSLVVSAPSGGGGGTGGGGGGGSSGGGGGGSLSYMILLFLLSGCMQGCRVGCRAVPTGHTSGARS